MGVGYDVDWWGVQEYVVVMRLKPADELSEPSVLQQFRGVGRNFSGWYDVQSLCDAVFQNYFLHVGCAEQVACEACPRFADILTHRGAAYVGIDKQHFFSAGGYAYGEVEQEERLAAVGGERGKQGDGCILGWRCHFVEIVAENSY